MSAARKYIQPYLHKVYDWTHHNNLIINPDKTTCTLFTPDPAEYNSNLGLNTNNKALPMALHPKVLGLTLDPKLTYNAYIQNIATHAQKPLQVIKALTGTTWGKQKETLVATYKAVMRPTLEYASSIWSPMASPTSINKLQVMQNAALRACTGCTHDTNIQHLHDETNILPIQKHLQLHASQIRQKAQYPSHPLYKYSTHNNSQRLKKPTTFNNSRYTTNIPTDPCTVTTADIKANMRDIHTTIVSQHLAARDNNKILRTHPPQVSSTEENLPRHTRRTLAQLRTNKSPFLLSYLHKIDASTHPSPLCPLCRTHEHTTQHLFSCPQIPTTLSALDLWRDPSGVAALLDDWREKVAANPHQTTEADRPNNQGGVGRQQQILGTDRILNRSVEDVVSLVEGKEMARNALPNSVTAISSFKREKGTAGIKQPQPDHHQTSSCPHCSALYNIYTEGPSGWNNRPHRMCLKCHRESREPRRQTQMNNAPSTGVAAVFAQVSTVSANSEDTNNSIQSSQIRLAHHIFSSGG